MNCRRANALISPLIDGELNGDEALRVRQHLDSCASCRTEYEAILGVKRLLASMPTAEPRPGFEEVILRRLASESNDRTWATRATGWWFTTHHRSRVGLAAAFAILSLIVLALSVRFTTGENSYLGRAHNMASIAADGSLANLSGRDVGFVHETFGRPQPVSYRVGEPTCIPDPAPATTDARWRGYLAVSAPR